ncbi:MAG: FAD-dependent oxidoreductase [Reyranella sp.]|nr:FAD-dependent oxidoreductase [Reyranella sp.]
MSSHTYRHYPYRRPAELDGRGGRRPVVIAGAGLAGPTLALALALRGVPSVILDEDDTVSVGSRSICQARHSLEVWDRFGVARRMVDKGITWEQGEVYLGDRPIYHFNLAPEPGHKFPAFVNLQQYYVEEYLFERCLADDLIDLRFRHRLVGVQAGADGVTVEVETPDGRYALDAEWLVACDGVRSTVRHLLDLPFPGEVFHDQFLIADIRLASELPKERRFWFYPPFHPTNSVLLHRQADNVLRVDFQLGRDADPEEEKKPENVDRRLRQMFGPDTRWEHEWTSVYTFTCRMMERFVQGRVIFAGDAAHVVSPFGARGGNAAIADVDNLAWKLARVLSGASPAALLDTYCSERRAAARENILNSTRSTDFITPKFPAARAFRDAALSLAREFPFARALINSGRLSVPTAQSGSPLDTPDGDADWRSGPAPGLAMLDAPVANRGGGFLIDHVGPEFTLISFAGRVADLPELPAGVTGLMVAREGSAPAGWTVLHERDGLVRQRYDGRAGTAYLIRPDRYVAARWRKPAGSEVASALRRATGNG